VSALGRAALLLGSVEPALLLAPTDTLGRGVSVDVVT
jgi:hypothetical protein